MKLLYTPCREQYKADYQRKMEQELDDIRLNTGNEIEKIQRSIKDMYEREIRYNFKNLFIEYATLSST